MANIARLKATALRMITRWGRTAQLDRSGSLRNCKCAIVDYRPRDRDLVTDGARRALIAAQGLTIPPDRELDILVFNGQRFRFAAKPTVYGPDGTDILYDCEVIYDAS